MRHDGHPDDLPADLPEGGRGTDRAEEAREAPQDAPAGVAPGAAAGDAAASGADASSGAVEAPPASGLDPWSEERHRELELYLAHDREVEALRRRAQEAAERDRRERAARLREAELPPELRDVDDDDWVPGRRRRLVMGTSRVVAAVALVAVLALAVTAVL